MSCACNGRSKTIYVWTSADGKNSMEYQSLVVVTAAVRRKGGSYVTKQK